VDDVGSFTGANHARGVRFIEKFAAAGRRALTGANHARGVRFIEKFAAAGRRALISWARPAAMSM